MSNSARILLVDDDHEILNTLSAVLKDAGYTVDTAETGRDAVEKSTYNFYNVALIDIRLPDIEGTKLLTTLKETTPKMVKIIVTGYPSLQNAVEAVNKGADGYIIKPAKAEELLNTVRERLREQQEAKQYDEQKIKDFIETRIGELDTEEKKHSKRG